MLQFSIENQPSWVITDGKLCDNSATAEDDSGFNKIWVLDEGMGGSQNIDDSRLMHLDGSPLSTTEWDRMHRFTRLWRKLGWTVTETDRAACSLLRRSGVDVANASSPAAPADSDTGHWDDASKPFDYSQPINFGDFDDESSSASSANGGSAPPLPDITFELLDQLSAMKQILSMTTLTVEDLLTFYSTMSCEGPNSQYVRLFLTRQLRSSTSVFVADSTGAYLAPKNQTIQDQIAYIAAALSMKQQDISFLTTSTKQKSFDPSWTVDPQLNMYNVSRLLGYSLLASTLSVNTTDLFQIMAGFGCPFDSPGTFLRLLKNWAKMAAAGFPWQEVRYVVDQVPTPEDPLALTEYDSLAVANQLRQKMIDIHTTYPLITTTENKTPEYTRTVASLLLPSSTVDSILGLLQGTTIFSAPAPRVSDAAFPAAVRTASQGKATYTLPPAKDDQAPPAILQVTGILDSTTRQELQALIKSTMTGAVEGAPSAVQIAWEDAINR
jgi:hypothetical protein